MVTATDPELEQFTLSTVQKQIHWDDRPTLIFVAGRGAGKSTSMALRIRGMVDRGEIGYGERIMICGPDYTQLMDGTVKTFDYWFEDLIAHKVDGNKPKRMLHGNIEVLCRSGMNPDQTRSKECRLVWLDEVAQMDKEMLELANMNLRPTGARPVSDDRVFQLLLSTTPRGMNWLYRQYGDYLFNAENDDPNVGAYQMTMLEAHAQGVVRDDYLTRAMATYPPGSTKWKQEALGEFISYSGTVFNQHWKKIGAEPDFTKLPAMRYIVGGVDVGSVSPSCILLCGIDERGALYAFKEFYKARAEQHELAKMIGDWHGEFTVNKWVIDDADLWRSLRNGGLPTSPPNKKLDAAGSMMNYVNSLIARGMLYIDEHECPNLVREMQTLEYKDMQSGDEVTFLDKVKPNQSDHAIDCILYASRLLSSYTAMRSYGQEVGFQIA